MKGCRRTVIVLVLVLDVLLVALLWRTTVGPEIVRAARSCRERGIEFLAFQKDASPRAMAGQSSPGR